MNIHHVEVTVKPAYHFPGLEQTRLLSLDVRVRNDQGTSHCQETFSPDDLMSNFDQIMAEAARRLKAELLKYNQPQSLREHANDCLKGRTTDLDCVGTEGGKATTTTLKP